MHEIHELFLVESLEQSTVGVGQGIPSHVWHLVLVAHRLEFLHVDVEDAQTIGIPFFRMAAHQLHAQTNAQDRLLEVFDEGIQLLFAEIVHGRFRFAHSREDDLKKSIQMW